MTTGFSKYIYGPVPSRRLGRSLGVDLIPFKICTYDCIYCQLGKTTEKTMERRCYVPIKDVLSELKIKLAAEERVDHITIAGSGEPTLHSEIGELIARIKDITNIPLVVLTNGSLLYLEEVRDALMSADIIIPSLDAGDEDMFRHVNRPHNCILFENMVNGLIKFAGDFSGLLWLEVFLLSGLTGMPAEARKIARYANIIGAKKIHLNTVYRPPAEDFACPVDDRQIKKLAPLFQGMVEIAGADKNPAIKGISAHKTTSKEILNLLRRRPCTLADICASTGLHPHDVVKKMDNLIADKLIRVLRTSNSVFYKTAEKIK